MHAPETSLSTPRPLTTFAALALASFFFAACGGEEVGTFPGRTGDGEEPGADPGQNPGDPGDPSLPQGPGGACKVGRTYPGFGGDTLGATRVVAGAGADRQRVKPLSTLRTEYTRVLGAVPATLTDHAASIGQPTPRYFTEAESNAVALYSTYAVSFDGCQAMMTGAPYTTAPTLESAKTECAALGRKLWSRTLTVAEIDACADLAVNGLPKENPPRRNWAHVCASLLSSAGFITF